MNEAVVDASAAVKWVLDEPHAAAAARLLDGARLHAPDHWLAEAMNAVWGRVWRGELVAEQGAERIRILLRAPVKGVPLADLAPAAFGIAAAEGVTIYDALYVALAEARSLPLVTGDARLMRRLSGPRWTGRLRWVGDLD